MEGHDTNKRVVAELIVHLGRIASGDGLIFGLTAAQWTALRFLARANRFSRTVSAFAEFHTTTRGTASQTIKGLVAEGYVTRTRSEADGRSTRLDLTDKGRAILSDDPFEALVRAAGAVSSGGRSQLAVNLERMLGHVARERGKRPFGMCPSCTHLECEQGCIEDMPAYECWLMRQRLEAAELGEICVNFEPGKASAMKRAFGGKAAR